MPISIEIRKKLYCLLKSTTCKVFDSDFSSRTSRSINTLDSKTLFKIISMCSIKLITCDERLSIPPKVTLDTS